VKGNFEITFIEISKETVLRSLQKKRIEAYDNERGSTMYLPKIYEKFSGKFPEVFKDFKQLGQTCRGAGPLDQKALDAGATPEEIYQAVLLALTTTGFPNMIAALGWVDEVLEEA
jgi:hypothetical protein